MVSYKTQYRQQKKMLKHVSCKFTFVIFILFFAIKAFLKEKYDNYLDSKQNL